MTSSRDPGETAGVKLETSGQPDLLAALAKIEALARPGQELGISGAIDVLCDVWNTARAAIAKAGASQ